MDKETYEALKEVVAMAYESGIANGSDKLENAIDSVLVWIDEVAKEYDE